MGQKLTQEEKPQNPAANQLNHKKKLLLKRLVAALTGFLFAGYAAYYVFIIFRDGKSLTPIEIMICAAVAMLFGVFAVFAWTAGVKGKDIRYFILRVIRRRVFIVALLTVFLLKLRMAGRTVDYLASAPPYALLYGFAYFMTLAAMLILFVYYVFFRKYRPAFPKISVILPLIAMALFLGALALEMILFLKYHVCMEASPLRTAVMRPVFYLGFVGLCAYFLFPRQTPYLLFAPVRATVPAPVPSETPAPSEDSARPVKDVSEPQ